MAKLSSALAIAAWSATLSLCVHTAAQNATLDGYGARARTTRPIAATSDEDSTAAGTELVVEAHTPAGSTIGDVVADAPGARVYRGGSLGSFTSVALRGTEVEHTAVVLGSLPLSSPDAAAFDLGTVPASLMERVVIYRGGAPIWLSQGAIGGVVQLVPREARTRELAATATLGSYELWGLHASSALVTNSSSTAVYSAAGITGSEGDFPYRSDNGSVLDPSDDFDTRRRNADTLDGHGLLHVRQRVGDGDLRLLALGFERVGGEPVSPANPALRARRNLTRAIAAVSYDIERLNGDGERIYRAQLAAGGSFQRSRFSDLFGEVGSGTNRSDDHTWRGFGRLAGGLGVTRWLELTLLGTGEHQVIDPDDAFRLVPLPTSSRDIYAGAAEANLHGRLGNVRFELRPSVRLEHSRARLHAERLRTLVTTDVGREAPTYRAAAVVEPIPGLALSASATSGERVPSLLELFGDGALLVGNPFLAPERSTAYDASAVGRGHAGKLEGTAELRVFSTHIEDLVVWIPTSLRERRPENLRTGRILGSEAGVRGSYDRWLSLSLAATWLGTEGKAGKELPHRADLAGHVRPAVRLELPKPLDRLTLSVEAEYVGASEADPDNVQLPRPAQVFAHAEATLLFLAERAAFQVAVRDAFDRGGFDIRGFQLPGRMLIASFTYKEKT